jgi:hypothetical protein
MPVLMVNELSSFKKGEECLGYHNGYYHLKKGSAPWSSVHHRAQQRKRRFPFVSCSLEEG